ncbi:hypothetical protein GCM10009801_51160 [Streptomyces albiaxialis]|uniref:Centromere-binding protein ParB C-terminal domain-containing protein n=1 Tax=Streptomyces albiaxialis TaxID=329523 RepID=A0ABN2WCX5_9ACTN
MAKKNERETAREDTARFNDLTTAYLRAEDHPDEEFIGTVGVALQHERCERLKGNYPPAGHGYPRK